MKVLMLRHSAGFEHSYLPDAEVAFKQIGAQQDWNVETTHDVKRLTPEKLADLDLLVFATTGNLPLTDDQKNNIISFVKNGKAFMGVHNATDTGYDWPEYGKMIGGYFNGHPWHQEVDVIVEDTGHPSTRMLDSKFSVTDEIYTFKDWEREKTHVLMRIDNNCVDIEKGNREDNDYALAWCHEYGRGRVMYTGLGHPDQLWHEDWFREHILGSMSWALRLSD